MYITNIENEGRIQVKRRRNQEGLMTEKERGI